jgi:hypothetical protein
VIENISLPYPWWFLFLAFAAGLLYAYLLYNKEHKFADAFGWVKPTMAVLRALAVMLICILLLGPVIKSVKEEQKDPIIVIAQDKSKSIGSDTKHQKDANEALTSFISKIGNKYEVSKIQFAEEVAADSTQKISGNATNIEKAVQYIYDNYADQNIGAVVMLSDGIFNEGGHPAYAPVKFNAPFYTVALGDTSIRKDLIVKNVISNRIAYLGDQFPIQVDIGASSCAGATTKLKLEKSDGIGRQLIAEQNISIPQNDFFTTVQFMVDANQTGIVRYNISLSQVAGEVSLVNNKKEIYIEVLDGRQNVLILGNAPHPDIAVINQLISDHKNYKATTALIGPDKPNLADYDVVITHNLPSDQYDLSSELTVIKNKKIPVVFIAGTQINQSRFNLIQDVLKIKGNSRTNEEAEASIAGGFDLFTLSDDLKSRVSKFPPLLNLFGNYENGATSKVLFYQKIKKIPTKYPLLTFNEQNGIKNAVLAGEGIWKWKLTEFATYQNNESCQELLNKIIQLVTVKDDKRKFKVNLPKQIFKDNENLVFDAQLYNDAYEMINDPEVFLSIKDENKKEYKYTFTKNGNYYVLDAGQIPSGNYRFHASTLYKGQSLVFDGKFSVEAIQLEAYDLTARHDVLKALSDKFNGKMYTINRLDQLAEDLLKNPSLKPSIFLTTHSKAIIHYKWLFFLILLLLSTEWFMRRYFGSY